MAHFILEYSDNIANDVLALSSLFEKLHGCALDTGIFPYKGIRSRAYRCENFRIADGNPEHMFVHLTVLIGGGRSESEKELAASVLFRVYEQHFGECFRHRGVAMSFEMKELEPVYKYNKNNIQDFL
ncbi:5-carboxymethyl-2-hydroxymuconate Delta-isomerase [Gynuella sunshinyii]|uniref:5-carboxymethyl-2-hydroxymuconate isomerase n=1 Tax=Gynuella sunshinyii YC6258 TaxID=1445510 RepID=A0A0C5VSL3_9GAMM|nr:5-carboxymethyl-2-hydroxymuconate Delta-isomerase [Gynuella sunshinyii]AJQ97677.1 5-carboxymethyl-2-hydroxymuconate isomerase [Gynuella sunshinyii YC6258]